MPSATQRTEQPQERVPESLVAALAAIQHRLPIVAKGDTATVRGTRKDGTPTSYTYSYADLADFAKATYPLLAEVGLAFVAAPQFRGNQYVLVGALEHTSGQKRCGVFPLPNTNDPQVIGSAITYGRRYLLGCLTGAVSDADDDGQAAQKAASRPAQGNGRARSNGSGEGAASSGGDAPSAADLEKSYEQQMKDAKTPRDLADIGSKIASDNGLPRAAKDRLQPIFTEIMGSLNGAANGASS